MSRLTGASLMPMATLSDWVGVAVLREREFTTAMHAMSATTINAAIIHITGL